LRFAIQMPTESFVFDASYDECPHDSAHHGLALTADGAKPCDCRTIDDTV
jgi:hypothetical protein